MRKTAIIAFFLFAILLTPVLANESKTILCEGRSVKEVIEKAETEIRRYRNFLILRKKMYKISLSTYIIEIEIQKNE